jgi:hypothetical protein
LGLVVLTLLHVVTGVDVALDVVAIEQPELVVLTLLYVVTGWTSLPP